MLAASGIGWNMHLRILLHVTIVGSVHTLMEKL